MTREEKKKKAAAIGATIAITMQQNKPNAIGDSRWRVAGLKRLMKGRDVTHQYGRYV